jgi:hypothetical protein
MPGPDESVGIRDDVTREQVAEQRERHVADTPERRRDAATVEAVVVHGHVSNIKHPILNGPVVAHQACSVRCGE